MYQIDNATVAATLPASTSSGTAGYFTDGSATNGVSPTIVPAEFLNMLMMELLNVVSGAGLVPNKGSFNQVLTAIKALGRQKVYAADTGTANTYAVTNTVALAALPTVSGVVQQFVVAHTNSGATNSGNSTFNPDGLGAAPIFGLGGQQLQGGELIANGDATLVSYVGSLLNSGSLCWILIECTGGARQVASATSSQHTPTAGQIVAGSLGTAIAGGTANAISASFAAAPSAYVTGQPFLIVAATTNTGAMTAVVTLGGTAQASVPIVKGNNQALVAGDFPAGYPGEFNYSPSFGALVMQNPATGVSTAVPIAGITGILPTAISGTSTTAAVTISSGQAADSTGAKQLVSPGHSWAVTNGNAANGYQGGTTLPNSSTIHFFECWGSSGYCSFASTSLTPTLPTGYATYYRRVFSLNTTSAGALIPGTAFETQGGSLLFYLTTQVLDVNATPTATSRTMYALTVPTGLRVQPIGRLNPAGMGTSNAVIVTSADETDIAPVNGTTGLPGFDGTFNASSVPVPTMAFRPVTTNTSGQIGIRCTASQGAIQWITSGFIDFRRS